MHVIPKLNLHTPSSYWTLDWLTHPLRQSHDDAAHRGLPLEVPRMNVDSSLCMHDLSRCLDSNLDASGLRPVDVGCHTPTTSAYIKWSCAPSQNQSRYVEFNHQYTEQKTCKAGKSKYHQAACQMQRMPEVSLVVNDDKSFSISSGHSQIVLLFYVSVIMFTVNFFALISSDDVRRMWPRSYLIKCENVKTFKTYSGFVILLLLFAQRMGANNASRDLGMDWPKPNGTYFYGILAYFAVFWFASREDCEDLNDSTPTPNDFEPAGQPKVDGTIGTVGGTTMQLNVSGFNGTAKLQTKAFMQPGAGGNYRVRDISDLDGTPKELGAGDYVNTPYSSLWALTQLWVWPLLLLSAYVVKYNFQVDINVTVVFFGTFIFGLIELFSRRMLELKYVYKSVLKNDPMKTTYAADGTTVETTNFRGRGGHDFSIDTGLRLVYLLALVIQGVILAMTFWAANWSFNPSTTDAGVWITGAPGKYKRADTISVVKGMFFAYYIITLLAKILCLLPSKWGSMDYGSTVIYQHLDAFCFFILNLLISILLMVLVNWAAIAHHEMQYYNAGVYMKHLAAAL